tara:strand:- start:535 stop:936 length:402 start_codon:yes stop_codon:yes gene_type:complete
MAGPKPTIDRPPTQEELDCIDEVEKRLDVEKELPSHLKMARSLAIDSWRSLKAFVRGRRVLTSPEKSQYRWEMCKECPHLKYDETNPDTGKRDGRCTECGCFMNIKVHFESSECPIGRWKRECGHIEACKCDE